MNTVALVVTIIILIAIIVNHEIKDMYYHTSNVRTYCLLHQNSSLCSRPTLMTYQNIRIRCTIGIINVGMFAPK